MKKLKNFKYFLKVQKRKENERKYEFKQVFANFMNNLTPLFIRHNFNTETIFEYKLNIESFAFSRKIKEIELNLSGRPSKSTMIEENQNVHVLSSSIPFNSDYKTLPVQIFSPGETSEVIARRREDILQIDMNRILCFTGTKVPLLDSQNQLSCCQCISKKIYQKFIKATSEFDLNWLFKYCSYYFLVTTASQAYYNNSLIRKYSQNVQLNVLNESNLTNMTSVFINKVEFVISNEFLDNRTKFSKDDENVKTEIKAKLLEQVHDESHREKNVVPTETETQIIENKSEDSVESVKIAIPNEKIDTTVTELKKETISETDISHELKDSEGNTKIHIQPVILETTTASSTTTTSTTPVITYNVNNEPEITTETAASSQFQSTTQAPIVIANGKEAVFIRLSNRIRMLELNMSLSSQYLEKLSQHYR